MKDITTLPGNLTPAQVRAVAYRRALGAPGRDAANIVVADFETTGLPHEAHFAPLQVAALVVNRDLEVLAGYQAVIATTEDRLALMNDYVRAMHTATGLLACLNQGAGRELAEVDAELAELIAQFFPKIGDQDFDGGRFCGFELAGNSVSGVDIHVFDQFFTKTQQLRSHRVLDASSLWRMAQRWNRQLTELAPDSGRNHDALNDCLGCLDELKHLTGSPLRP